MTVYSQKFSKKWDVLCKILKSSSKKNLSFHGKVENSTKKISTVTSKKNVDIRSNNYFKFVKDP